MSDLNYEPDLNFQGMIDNLIDGSWGNTSDDFSGNTLLDDNGTNYSRRTNQLWNQLLLHMHNKFATFDNNKYHYGIRENDFPTDKESIVEFINNNIDLDKDGVSLLDKYFSSQLENNNHWNESIAKLAEYYYNLFKNSNNEDEIDKTNITIKDLKNANAGASFLKDSEWVIPWENIDKNNYADIRNNDKIQNVLSNKDNLQFTQNEQLNQYLRLIMPEYKRIVEIEDINRNFWVIGQALTALCGFLFEDDSPLPQLMATLLDEIAQLWENIFFLWLALSLLSYKNFYEDVETVFLPISNNEVMPNVKFDNFDDTGLGKEKAFKDMDKEDLRELLRKIWEERMEFLKDKYNNCAIVVFPEIRVNNYMKNYYSKAVYIGCIVYDDSLQDENDWLKFIPFNGAMIIDLKEQKITLPDRGGYDETKIAIVLLDENNEPTDMVEYFDTTEQSVLRNYLQNHLDHNYMLRIGSMCPVTEITSNACYECTNLIKALILNELETIGASAFQGCANLCEINLPESLLVTGPNALNRTGVTSVTIPGSLYTIPYAFLSNCNNLQEIVIEPGTVEIQGLGAFQYCPKLSSISIPNSIEYIGTDTFQNCTALREILIPNSVTHMLSCFIGCSPDLTVYVDNTCVGTRDGVYGWNETSHWGLKDFNQLVWLQGMNVFEVGDGNTRASTGTQYTFDSFGALANWLRSNTTKSYWVDIGDTAGPITPAGPLPTLVSARFVGRNMTIYGGVFSGYAPNLEKLDTGDYMEQINDSFCNNCSKLSTVRIGTNVRTIGRSAFANCTALTSIGIPSNVETIDSEAFSNSSNLTMITVNKSEGSITGAPWGAINAQIVWTG